MTEKISVCIPTIGRSETLPMVLSSISFQTYPVSEVILLDESVRPVTDYWSVSQALDYLSILGVRIVILRDRNRKGIGAARYRLAEEARNDVVVQVDDDVVLTPTCIEELLSVYKADNTCWAVPTCLLVPGYLSLDGYTTDIVDVEEVKEWTDQYPWFTPYYRYSSTVIRKIPCAGTQCILFSKWDVLDRCKEMLSMGSLPREDTYLTTKLGDGMFTSLATCIHFEHDSQIGRHEWGRSTFYRLHEACLEDPDKFIELWRDGK